MHVHRFIVSKEIPLDDSYDEYDQDSVDEMEERRKKHRQSLLAQVDFEKFVSIQLNKHVKIELSNVCFCCAFRSLFTGPRWHSANISSRS